MPGLRFTPLRKKITPTATKPNPAPKPKLPWQKFHRAVPPNILAQVKAFKTDVCVVSCAKKLKISDIEHGLYGHLGIRIDDGKLVFPKEIIPPSWVGSYSHYNRVVREIVHRDLPKTTKSWDIDAPNYGNSSNGTHSVTMTKPVYLRTYERPKLNAIVIEHLGEDLPNSLHILKFTVEEVLDRDAPDFEDSLLTNLNLLQENVGNHGVFETDASHADYLRTLYVSWEILPPGEREETFTRILSGIRTDDPKVRAELRDRYEFLYSLKPASFIRGSNGFRSYFGALFAHDLVVFETIEYGNAIYIMFDEWEEMSKRSRTELLSLKEGNFRRIAHIDGWKRKLRTAIRTELRKRQQKH